MSCSFFYGSLLSSRVKRLTPAWNSGLSEDLDALFEDAVNVTGEEFKAQMQFVSACAEEASSAVPKAVQSRFEVHPSGSIVVLAADDGSSAWRYLLRESEEFVGAVGKVKFVIGRRSSSGLWRVSAVPVHPPHCSEYR